MPTPEDVLEDLASKTAAQIDHLAPVAFDSALHEMTTYHRFLLALNASADPDGSVYNLSEISGGLWNPPHREWIRQYRQLFQRAAIRLPDDDHFIRSLAHIPNNLLPGARGPEFPRAIVEAILQLGPMMIHRIEAWITKRTTVDRVGDELHWVRAQSDRKAYQDVLPEVIGAWEQILYHAPFMSQQWDSGRRDSNSRWSLFRASWPLLWQHLVNTANCLVIAVWNNDDLGAQFYRDALIRWPTNMRYRLQTEAHLAYPWMLSPEIVRADWSSAIARIAPVSHDFVEAPSPDELFSSVVHIAHDDVLLLTSALLQSWAIEEERRTNLCEPTADELLGSYGSHRYFGNSVSNEVERFRLIFLNLLRFEMESEHAEGVSYSAAMNALVEALDSLTEQPVVPGQTYTPSTLQDRHGLRHSIVALLLKMTPGGSEDLFGEEIGLLTSEEKFLPEGDRSLRRVLDELERWRALLEPPRSWLAEGRIRMIVGPAAEDAGERLVKLVASAVASIQAYRHAKLLALPIDSTKLDGFRSAMESALLDDPSPVPFLMGVSVGTTPSQTEGALCSITFDGIDKAQLTDPLMESPSLNLEEVLVGGVVRAARNYVLRRFHQRARTVVATRARPEEVEFWRDLAPCLGDAGPNPVLVVAEATEGSRLRRLMRSATSDQLNVKIERRRHRPHSQTYIATIEGVDVYEGPLMLGKSWLVAAKTLRNIKYRENDGERHFVEIIPQAVDETTVSLEVRFFHHLEWADAPIHEIHGPDLNDERGQ